MMGRPARVTMTSTVVPLLENDGHRLGRPVVAASAWWVSCPRRPDCPFPNWIGSHTCVTVATVPYACRTTGIPGPTATRSRRRAAACIRWCRSRSTRRNACTRRVNATRKACCLWVPRPRWHMITRDFNERPLIPWHQTSTGRAGVLTTFVAGSGAQLIPGPPSAWTRFHVNCSNSTVGARTTCT